MGPVLYSSVFAKREPRRPTIVVDLDGTIAGEDSHELDKNEPLPGCKEALDEIKAAGYEIVVFTCRMNSEGRPAYVIALQKAAIEDWLTRYKIPFDEVYDGRYGKKRADFYLDNKAIRITPENWADAAKEILGSKP
jgi:capsule biosynthesis phosphatase